jgi:CheY-like chemotaxis protein
MKSDDLSVTIIDDDETVHYIIKTMIKRENPRIAISSFRSAIEFLNTYTENFVSDGILLDINMPGMSGWELLDRLTQIPFNIPVYMFSSSGSLRDLDRSSRYGFVKGYFIKPLTTETLRSLLSQIEKTIA